MTLAPCPFCTHSNPAGARFCNECGSPLHLLPCEHCEAVNDALSRDCYRCGAPLRSEAHREPMGTLAYADVGDALVDREATTVVLAYGDEPRTPLRATAAWSPAGTDVERESLSMRDPAAVLDAATAHEREPLMDTLAADDNAEGRVAHHVASSARPFVAFVAALSIVGLAALGGYTFIQRGEAPIEAQPLPPPIPAPAAADVPTPPAEPPQAREPALPQADTPTTPAPTTSPRTTSPRTESPPTESPPPADASPGVAPDTGKMSAAESPPKVDRKPATASSPKPSQDAIETQRIIMRELGSFAPPTR